MSRKQNKIVFLPDEIIEGEDFVDPDQLAADILEGYQAAREWARGERTLRGSEWVNGEWVEVEDTGPEFLKRREREAQAEKPPKQTAA